MVSTYTCQAQCEFRRDGVADSAVVPGLLKGHLHYLKQYDGHEEYDDEEDQVAVRDGFSVLRLDEVEGSICQYVEKNT